MTAQTKLVLVLFASAVLAAWGAHELLRAALDPIIHGLAA